MALYFAMVDGEKVGPFPLEEMADRGVGPDTYIWTKGMDDWEPAGDNADICRFFRRRIFDSMHPSPAFPEPAENDGTSEIQKDMNDGAEEKMPASGYPFPMPDDEPADIDNPPTPLLAISILMTFLCFPVTGLVAIYYAVLSRKAWNDALRSESKKGRNLYTDQERRDCKRAAHSYARSAKMWIGITFFMGMILYAFIGHTF